MNGAIPTPLIHLHAVESGCFSLPHRQNSDVTCSLTDSLTYIGIINNLDTLVRTQQYKIVGLCKKRVSQRNLKFRRTVVIWDSITGH